MAFAESIDALDHGIETSRHNGAGEDAHRAIRRRRMFERVTRGGLAGDLEPCTLFLVVSGMGEGIAVDRGIVVGRNGPGRDDRLRKKAARSLVQGNLLGPHHGAHPRLQDRQRLVMREPVLVEDEAIVDQLGRHGCFSPSCATMKSAMPAMSSRWKTGSDSVSVSGRSEAIATI